MKEMTYFEKGVEVNKSVKLISRKIEESESQ